MARTQGGGAGWGGEGQGAARSTREDLGRAKRRGGEVAEERRGDNPSHDDG